MAPDSEKRVRVAFYRTAAGNLPVREWLKDLDPEDRKIVGDDLRTVELGWPLGMPLCRSLIPILFQRIIKKLRLFPRKGGRHDGLSQIISGRDSIAGPSAY
ncbi:MAG: hypothetical protein V9G98_11470 [Candidatus Competibacter sp.]